MKPRISMITLAVRDLARSISFYEDGLKLPRRESPPSIAFFTLNGTWLSLYGREALAEDAQIMLPKQTHPHNDAAPCTSFALAHNLASPEEVDQMMDEALAAGARLIKKPQPVFWGGYSGYFADYDGYLWELAHNPFAWVGPQDD